MKSINETVLLNGKTYQIRISVDAPKTEAQLIINEIQKALIKRGLIQ